MGKSGTWRGSRIRPCPIFEKSESSRPNTIARAWEASKLIASSLPLSAYTIVESTTHSLAIDVLTGPANDIGTLFLSDADGIYFVEALANTNRNDAGYVDYESLVGLEGIGLANVVRNAQDVLVGREEKKVMSLMTYDDGKYPDRVAHT
jgi:hypothetical protein